MRAPLARSPRGGNRGSDKVDTGSNAGKMRAKALQINFSSPDDSRIRTLAAGTRIAIRSHLFCLSSAFAAGARGVRTVCLYAIFASPAQGSSRAPSILRRALRQHVWIA